MNRWKIYAIILTVLTLGAFKEIFRIVFSDVGSKEGGLFVGIPIVLALVFFTVRAWRKSDKKEL